MDISKAGQEQQEKQANPGFVDENTYSTIICKPNDGHPGIFSRQIGVPQNFQCSCTSMDFVCPYEHICIEDRRMLSNVLGMMFSGSYANTEVGIDVQE